VAEAEVGYAVAKLRDRKPALSLPQIAQRKQGWHIDLAIAPQYEENISDRA
jgi:hypothetical protein